MKRIFLPDQERGHHGVIFPIHLSDAGKQLDKLVHFMRIKEVLAGDLRDSFRIYFFVTCGFSCHEGGENGNLAAGVIAFHIRFGIAFRVTLLLCFLQAGLKIAALLSHAGEDVVGGSIQDSVDQLNPLRGQCRVQGTDDGNTASHARFEQIIAGIFLRRADQLGSVVRHQLLIGGADALSGFQGLHGIGEGGFVSAHGFADDRNLRILQDDVHIMHHPVRIRVSGKIPEIQNIFHPDFLSGASVDHFLIFLNHFYDAAAHRAVSQNRYADHVFPPLSASADGFFV